MLSDVIVISNQRFVGYDYSRGALCIQICVCVCVCVCSSDPKILYILQMKIASALVHDMGAWATGGWDLLKSNRSRGRHSGQHRESKIYSQIAYDCQIGPNNLVWCLLGHYTHLIRFELATSCIDWRIDKEDAGRDSFLPTVQCSEWSVVVSQYLLHLVQAQNLAKIHTQKVNKVGLKKCFFTLVYVYTEPFFSLSLFIFSIYNRNLFRALSRLHSYEIFLLLMPMDKSIWFR